MSASFIVTSYVIQPRIVDQSVYIFFLIFINFHFLELLIIESEAQYLK